MCECSANMPLTKQTTDKCVHLFKTNHVQLRLPCAKQQTDKQIVMSAFKKQATNRQTVMFALGKETGMSSLGKETVMSAFKKATDGQTDSYVCLKESNRRTNRQLCLP